MTRRTLAVVKIVDVQKRRVPSKHYVYVISSTWCDGTVNVVYRRYSKFFDLQMRLIDEFPEEGGVKDPSNRTLPFLPGKIIFGRSNTRGVALKRMEPISEYCKKLILLPHHISQCDLVLKFFEPIPEDINIPHEKKKSKRRETVDVISDPVMLDQYVAVADYKKQNKNEVNMVAGDVVEVIDKNENGWWFVNVDEELGWVPAAYLEAICSEDEDDNQNARFAPGKEEKYIATQIYKAELDDEISLEVGAFVEVIQKNFDGWWLVRYRGREGWAPAMYLKKADACQVLFAGMAAPAVERISPTPARKADTVKIPAKPANNQIEKPKTKAGVRGRAVPPRKASVKRPARRPLAISNAHYGRGVEALHDYETIETEYITLGEFRAMGVNSALDFQGGNTVKVLEKSPNGWWYGKIGNEEGWIPSSHIGKRGRSLERAGQFSRGSEVDTTASANKVTACVNSRAMGTVKESSETEEVFIAVADYEDDNESSVSFKEGDIASVYEKRDGGWWFVSMNGIEGWAPSDYLEKRERKTAAPPRPKPPTKQLGINPAGKQLTKPSPPGRPKSPAIHKTNENERKVGENLKSGSPQRVENFPALKLPEKDACAAVSAKPSVALRTKDVPTPRSHMTTGNPMADIKRQLEEKMLLNSSSSGAGMIPNGDDRASTSSFPATPPKPTAKPVTHKHIIADSSLSPKIPYPAVRPRSGLSASETSGTATKTPIAPPRPKPALKHTASQSNMVVAIASYTHDGDGGVSFLEGEKFEFVKDSCTGWWLVRRNGQEAWAPASYLEKTNTANTMDSGTRQMPVKPAKPKPPRPAQPEKPVKPVYVAHATYRDDDGDALSFDKGDTMEVLEQDDGGWWLVNVNGKTGWAPSNYLKLVGR